MQSLLRTQPENLDDLTVQVALVRPGPIQGKAVHPYIDAPRAAARRSRPTCRRSTTSCCASRSATRSASSSSRTRCSRWRWRSPGFTIGEAEGLRRAMSRKRSEEAIEALPASASSRAPRGTASTRRPRDRVYDKLAAFSGFGFPKSHAAAFGAARLPVGLAAPPLSGRVPLLAPERAADGLLPAVERSSGTRSGAGWRCGRRTSTSARCRRARGRTVRCGWGSTTSSRWGRTMPRRLVAEREANGQFADVGDLSRRVPLDARELEALLRSGACDRWGKRRDLLWELGLVSRAADACSASNKPAGARARPDRGHARPARPDRLGADARRLRARRASRSTSTR